MPPPPYKMLRLYTFCNFYLSSIQQGIQSAHVVSELFNVYDDNRGDDLLLKIWATKHKTIIVCNGGMGQDLIEGFDSLAELVQRRYPICSFNEEFNAFGSESYDEDSGCSVGPMTCFGIVLPDTVFDAKPVWKKEGPRQIARKTGEWEYGAHGIDYFKWAANSVEATICEYVTSKHLAR